MVPASERQRAATPEWLWPVLALVVLAGAGVCAFVLGGPPPGPVSAPAPVTQPPTDPEAVTGFLAAYERSRTGTFVVEQRFTRTVADTGDSFTVDTRLVQRPPGDRLVMGLGSVSGRVDGRVVRCASEPSGTTRCTTGEPARPYDEEVAAELEALEPYVAAARPLYRVEQASADCFRLVLVLDLPTPPYGVEAMFCFDADTGAPTRLEVRRPESVDLTEAVSIRTEVTPADLRLDDLGELPD